MNYQPEWVTPDRVKKAFLGFQIKKSPGTDGLKPIILKHLPDDIIHYISPHFIMPYYFWNSPQQNGKNAE